MERTEELLRLLVSNNLIDAAKGQQLVEESIAQKQRFSDFLLAKGFIEEEKLTEIKAQLYKLPYYNAQNEEVSEQAINFLPAEIAKTYSLVCLELSGKVVKVGMVEPNLKGIEAVNFLSADEKLQVEYYLISQSSWEKVFKQYQRLEEEISTALELKAKEEGEEDLAVVSQDSQSLSDEDINSAPVSRIVSVIIRHAVEARASDIHIEPFAKESRVRYRIDGILHTSLTLPKSIHNAVVARIKVLAKLKLDETRVPQDGRIRLVVNNREVDFRVSTLPLINQEKVVMRILDTSRGAPGLEDLGFNHICLDKIREGIKKTNGIVLVTGPTGSGKTTTLYSLLNILNQEGVNISTLEDPIEYEIKGINQSQVRPKIGFSFANGLRSLLRQDPNIIMVGEIRDEETAGLSINAALTGHLVLSTLHTNDALGAIYRLLDMNVERFLLASTLKTLIAQRLARRLCSNCRQETELAPDALQEAREELSTVSLPLLQAELPGLSSIDDIGKMKVYKAVGCNRCENTGYSGRVAISETIDVNEQLKEIIDKGKSDLQIADIQSNQPFYSMKQDGVIKVLQGLTTMQEILRIIES